MSDIKISVVVPVLNTVNYIQECLESIRHQTLKEIEVICVDGGSTDGSLKVQQQYAVMDSRFSVVTDVYRSYGKQVNRGIELAQGKYVGIVEPDDYIDADMYENLYQVAEHNNAEMVRADYYSFIGEGEKKSIFPRAIVAERLYNRNISIKECQEIFNYGPPNWNGIYRKDFLTKNNIRHNETPGASFQDLGFAFLTLAMAHEVCFIQQKGYFYRLDNSNSSVKKSDKMAYIFEEFRYVERKLTDAGLYYIYSLELFKQKVIHYKWGFYRTADSEKEFFWKKANLDVQKTWNDILECNIEVSCNERKTIEQLLNEMECLYAQYLDNKKQINCLMEAKVPWLLFGCGTDGINFLLMMKEQMTNMHAILDNNQRLQGLNILNKRVLEVKEGVRKYPDAFYIIASAKYAHEMKNQLLELGIETDKILIQRMV